MLPTTRLPQPPYTEAVRRALNGVNDARLAEDLLFLEAWEIRPSANLGLTLKASQIRRANPALTAEIEGELRALPKRGRPS